MGGNSLTVTGNLSVTGAGRVGLDPYFLSGDTGGSSLTISGTLTNSSTDGQAIDIGNGNIGAGDTLTAGALVNNTDISVGVTAAVAALVVTVRQRITAR